MKILKAVLVLILFAQVSRGQYVLAVQDTTALPVTNLFEGREVRIGGAGWMYHFGGWHKQMQWTFYHKDSVGGGGSTAIDSTVWTKKWWAEDQLSQKAATAHGHAQSEVTGLSDALADKQPSGTYLVPSDTNALRSGLDGKAASAHTHAQSAVTGLVDSIAAKLNRSEYTPGGGGLGYTIHVQALTSSPADGATVYFGMLPKAPTTSANISKVYIRKAGTIKIANVYCYSGTAGTAENWSLYVRLNNTTDYLIATVGAATSERVFTNSSLSIAVVAGNYIEIKGVQPTWATNPLTTIYGGYIYIE